MLVGALLKISDGNIHVCLIQSLVLQLITNYITDGICEIGYELFGVVDSGNKTIRIIKECNLEINAKVGQCEITGISR